jgi:gliding motility-associated lipoprotein GldH
MTEKIIKFSIFHAGPAGRNFQLSITFLLLTTLFILSVPSCNKKSDNQYYHCFINHSWYRFNILQFEIPVEKSDQRFDVYLFIRHNRDYEFNTMDFNMVMTTPSGEERIREYQMNIRNKGGNFSGRFIGDSCEVSIALTSEMHFPKKGILTIKIENLIPRMETNGLLGVGIRMKPVG